MRTKPLTLPYQMVLPLQMPLPIGILAARIVVTAAIAAPSSPLPRRVVAGLQHDLFALVLPGEVEAVCVEMHLTAPAVNDTTGDDAAEATFEDGDQRCFWFAKTRPAAVAAEREA